MMNHTPAPASSPPCSAAETIADDFAMQHGALASNELLQGRSSIAIDHQGMRYILRATRTGKLILTK